MFDLGLSKETSKALRIVGIILFLGMLGKFVLFVALFGAAPTVSEKLHHPSPPIVRGNFPLQEKWNFSSNDNIVSTPTMAGNSVVIATSTLIYKLDLETAHVVWQTQASGSISNPLKVFDNFVVAGGSSLRVLDLQTGQVLWERFDSEWSDVRPLSYSKGMLFVQYAHFEMFVYDISTGEILWGKKFSRNRIDIFPDGDFVYILSNHELAKYDIKTGEPVHKIKLENYSGVRAYKSGLFYIGERVGEDINNETLNIVAFDPRPNEIIWRTTIDQGNTSSPNSIFVGDNGIFVGERHGLLYLDLSGNEIWRNINDGSQAPVVIDDVVYYRGVFDENIYAVSLESGEYIGDITFNTESFWGQSGYDYELGVASNESILFFCMKNKLFAYEKH